MNFITDPATKFDFMPADFVPFKDKKVCEYVRSLSGKDLEKREDWWHPEFEVKVMMNPHPVLISTLFTRLKAASEAGKSFTMILDGPCQNIIKHTGASVCQAFKFASTNPAKVLGLSDRGRIAVGNIANLIVVDHLFNVKYTVFGGEIVK